MIIRFAFCLYYSIYRRAIMTYGLIMDLIYGLQALLSETRLALSSIFLDSSFVTFLGGVLLCLMVTLFIFTKNPQYIPSMLCLSATECLTRFVGKNKTSTDLKYKVFVKLQKRIRILSISILILCALLFFILYSSFQLTAQQGS